MPPRQLLSIFLAPKVGRAILRIRGGQCRFPSPLLVSPQRGFFSTVKSMMDDGPSPGSNSIGTSSSIPNNQKKSNYVYGMVKNYVREKGFGFITLLDTNSNNADADTIYVHRSGIKSTKLLPPATKTSTSITSPFLRRSERVRFLVVDEPSEKGPLKAARELEYEDGTQIPIYRPGYVENCKKYSLMILGEVVFQVMKLETDESVRFAKIKASYERAKQAIEDAQTRYDAMNTLLKTKFK